MGSTPSLKPILTTTLFTVLAIAAKGFALWKLNNLSFNHIDFTVHQTIVMTFNDIKGGSAYELLNLAFKQTQNRAKNS